MNATREEPAKSQNNLVIVIQYYNGRKIFYVSDFVAMGNRYIIFLEYNYW